MIGARGVSDGHAPDAGCELHVGVGGWNKGNEGAVERKEDLLNATTRMCQRDRRIWQYNGCAE